MTVKVTPYLMMNGNAKEAIQFYEKALDAQVLNRITYGETPDLPSGDIEGLIAHAKLKIGESMIMLSDTPSNSPVEQGSQVTMCLTTADVETSRKYFEALEQEGVVKMPFQETSFSTAYGSLTDKFGVTFQIDTENQN